MKRPLNRNPSPYILEIGGISVVGFLADTFSQAQELLRETWFRTELRERRIGGRALWDGQSQLTVRRAVGNEIKELASQIGEHSSAGDLALIYLVPIDP